MYTHIQVGSLRRLESQVSGSLATGLADSDRVKERQINRWGRCQSRDRWIILLISCIFTISEFRLILWQNLVHSKAGTEYLYCCHHEHVFIPRPFVRAGVYLVWNASLYYFFSNRASLLVGMTHQQQLLFHSCHNHSLLQKTQKTLSARIRSLCAAFQFCCRAAWSRPSCQIFSFWKWNNNSWGSQAGLWLLTCHVLRLYIL